MQQLPTVTALAPEDILRCFVPARRFGTVSFESYQPDPRYPSQSAALERMRRFAAALSQPPRSRFALFRKRREEPSLPRAIYLDGGFGVGKTHLLAATYHALPSSASRYYLTFADLAYAITRLGMQPALEAFSKAKLVCIDEFELDDVAQTRMASMFLRELLGHDNTHVVTTSNTLPSDLGQGRFAADAFQREIGEIAGAFEVVSIDGEDYRHRHWDDLAQPRPFTSRELHARYEAAASTGRIVAWPDLAQQLGRVHPVHYGQIAAQLDALYIDALQSIDDQAVALRLVHFVDKLYEAEVRLSLSAAVALPDIFAASYRHGGYEKKYRRCLSRLHELLMESSPIGEGVPGQI